MQVKAFPAPCPTRFGTMMFSLRSVVDSKGALQRAVLAEGWSRASEGSSKAEDVRAAVLRTTNARLGTFNFFDDAEQLLRVVQPVMDAIHTIEADKPLLSQMLPLYNKLQEHFTSVEEECDERVAEDNLLQLFKDRREKHFHDCFYAAFLLDPINFQLNAASKWTMPFNKLSREEVSIAFKVMKGLAVEATQEVGDLKAEWSKAQLRPLAPDLAEHIPHLTTRTARGDGTVAVAAVEERVTWWMSFAADAYPLLAKAAGKLLGMHVTTCAPEKNWSQWGVVYTKSRNCLQITSGEKIVFIRGNTLLGSSGQDCDVTEQLCIGDEQEELVEEISE
jgi:hypothetical protein